MNLDQLSELNRPCSDDVPPVLSRRDKTPVVLHVARHVTHQAAERDIELAHGSVYVIEAVGLGLYKIGMTNDFSNRFSAYATTCPVDCRPVLVAAMPLMMISAVEAALHARFSEKLMRGEWFRLSDEDIASLPGAVEQAAKENSRITRHVLRSKPLRREKRREARVEREIQARILRMQQAAAVPTDELILDRITDAQQFGRKLDMTDLVRSIDRKPQLIHEHVRDMICSGELAISEPRRNPNDGAIWLDAYRYANIIIPDESCDWELTNCGHEILVSEPLGEFVPEFFGRTR